MLSTTTVHDRGGDGRMGVRGSSGSITNQYKFTDGSRVSFSDESSSWLQDGVRDLAGRRGKGESSRRGTAFD